MRKLILAVGLSALLAGCASSGRVGDLPVIAPGQSAGKIVLIRVSSIVGVANSYYITLDSKDVFAIRSGEHTELKVAEGEHYVGVKCFGGWSPTWKEDSIKFAASSTKTSAFEISPDMTCARIRPLGEDEAKQGIAATKFISPDTASGAK